MPLNEGKAALSRHRGVLLHVSSLPSKYGVGNFGRTAYRFIDMLADAGADLWAFLPLGPTGFGDSPYQCFSSFALNPYFLDLETLCRKGLLTRQECEGVSWGESESECDYGALYRERLPLLLTAFARAEQKKGFEEELTEFEDKHPYVGHYALFMAVRELAGGRPWYEWPEHLKRRSFEPVRGLWREINHDRSFYLFIQKELFEQWDKLHAYAKRRGVALMGDMPIYCAYDSADCWYYPRIFQLDGELRPKVVAGVPPDYFSELGQKWGNPLYDWDALRRSRYAFWLDRMAEASRLFDILRIDHFRGFEAYYSIPADSPDARRGEWQKACGYELFKRFDALRETYALPECEIVAEDLGVITPNVKRLLTRTGFAGMQVLQFAFDGGRKNPHLNKKWDGAPEHVINKYCYTGTHDNPPLAAWWQDSGREERMRALRYAGLTQRKDGSLIRNLAGDNDCAVCPGEMAEACEYREGAERRIGALAAHFISAAALRSVAKCVILPMQDILGLGAEARMNTPGTESGNWRWRLTKAQMKAAGESMKTLFAEE